MFKETNLCRIPFPFLIFKKFWHRPVPLRTHDQQMRSRATSHSWNRGTPEPRSIYRHPVYGLLCYSEEHITQGLAGKWSPPPWEDVRTSLVFSPSPLFSWSPKQCWFSHSTAKGLFSLDLCWAICNICSISNVSTPPRASKPTLLSMFLQQHSYPEKITSTK